MLLTSASLSSSPTTRLQVASHDGAVPRDQDPADVPVASHLSG